MIAEGLGFLRAASGPFVRSSFNAEEMAKKIITGVIKADYTD